jgi:cytochrome o ubiquinol oxidase operon protein cyoD
MSPTNALLVITITAVLQVLVHLRFFLHLSFTKSPRENLLAIVFTGVLLLLMLGGSFWIMFDLDRRMAL